jgi:CO/xanthine dehydrogenase Mo-binding subunit/aerobic-type carbon monoxide dehydrogenase small subunit (CoxS/CutS family)
VAEPGRRERVHLRVNGRGCTAEIDPRTSLRDCLHGALGHTEVKQGCAEGVCGACVVLFDGEPRASCLELAVTAGDIAITTVAGLADDAALAEAHARLRAQLIAREVFQCGYCAPGFVVEATHYLARGGAGDPDAVRAALAGHLCRCTGYHQIIEAIVAAANHAPPPVAPLPRPDLAEKIDGVAAYPSDHIAAGAAIARIVWSAHPAAELLAIDPAAALAVPGVERVLTWRDIPGQNLGAENIFGDDQPLLAKDRVRCLGDAVAVVIADSDAAARAGAAQVAVRYAVEPAVLGVEQALAPGAPRLGGHANTIAQFVEDRGDVDAAFRAADFIIEGTYRCSASDHMCMEPEGGLGVWNGETLELTVPTHSPHSVRTGVAKSLALAEAQIKVRTPRMGGAFGKYLVPGVDGLLALAAVHAGRPVRLVLDRAEIIARRAKRHPLLGTYRLAMRRDGAFLALDADVITDSGPYISITPTMVSVFAEEVCGAYAFPAVRARARGVLTNNLPSAPMRGFGSQQVNFGIEALVEKAARTAGLDPIAVRRLNFNRTRGDATGQAVPEAPSPLDLTFDRALARLGPRPVAPPGCRVGRGIAAVKAKYGFPYGFVDRFVVRAGIDDHGEFFVESDLPDSGTGVLAGVARLVAERLGLARLPRSVVSDAVIDDPTGTLIVSGRPPARGRRWVFRMIERVQGIQASLAMTLVIRLNAYTESRLLHWFARPVNWLNGAVNWLKSRWFPTSIDSFLPRAGSSRAMAMIGPAACAAADALKTRVIAAAASAFGVPPAQLTWTADGLACAGAPAITWAALAGRVGAGALTGLGRHTLRTGNLIDTRTGNQVGCADHMFATHAVDLAVNETTGKVQILRWVAVQDVGKVIDDAAIRGQVHGGLTMGLGQAVLEHLDLRAGAVANASMHDYLIASMLDVAPDPIIELIASGQGNGPDGAKGVGEASAVAGPIAVAHALYDALGVQLDLTTTPEQIVRFLTHAMEGSDGAGKSDERARQSR